jgi:hypothetical protein
LKGFPRHAYGWNPRRAAGLTKPVFRVGTLRHPCSRLNKDVRESHLVYDRLPNRRLATLSMLATGVHLVPGLKPDMDVWCGRTTKVGSAQVELDRAIGAKRLRAQEYLRSG